MRKKDLLCLLTSAVLFMLAGCATDLMPTSSEFGGQSQVTANKELHPIGSPKEVIVTSVPLVAKKKQQLGVVEAWNDETKLYIKIKPDAEWIIKRTQLAVEEVLENIPINEEGKINPQQFPYNTKHKPMVEEFTYELDLIWPVGTEIFLSLHAKLATLEQNKKGKPSKVVGAWAAGDGWPGDKHFDKYFTDVVDKSTVIIIGPPPKK